MKNKGKKAIGLLIVTLALLLGVLSGSVWAAELTVGSGGTYQTIKAAYANSSADDTIKIVTPGSYEFNYNDLIIKKNITIEGIEGSPNAVTLKNKYASWKAITIYGRTTPGITVTIKNLIIDGDGASAIACQYGNLTLENVTITNSNRAIEVSAAETLSSGSYQDGTKSVVIAKNVTFSNITQKTIKLEALPATGINTEVTTEAIFNYENCNFGTSDGKPTVLVHSGVNGLSGYKNHMVKNITTGEVTDLLPAEITITANDQTIKYGESLKSEPSEEVVTITTGLTEGDSLSSITLTPSTTEITADGTITPSAAKILSDETDVTSSYKITYAPGKLVIVESDSAVVTAPTVKSYLVYTGEEQELINAGSATGGTMKYAVTQSAEPVPEDSAFTETVPTGIEAGTYYVWYKVFGNAGHKDGEKISLGMVTISPASMIYKTEGAEYEKGSDQQSAQLKIEFTDEETNEKALEYFQSASVGGRTLTRDVDYIARKGSVEIILQHDYLEGLDVGEYQLIAEFNIDGDQFSIPVPFVVTAPIDAEISNYQSDGSKGIPEGVKDLDVILQFLIKQGDKTVAVSSPTVFAVKDGIMEKSHTILFNAKLKTELTNEYTVEVKVLSPKSVEVPLGIYDNQTKEELTQSYTLSAAAWPHNGKITVQLRWDDGKDHSVPELKVYALPEDEIGAYAMRKDGTKEYLLFHTYDICMAYLGRDDLCRGYERCFHKESPYVNPFVKP